MCSECDYVIVVIACVIQERLVIHCLEGSRQVYSREKSFLECVSSDTLDSFLEYKCLESLFLVCSLESAFAYLSDIARNCQG